MSTSHNAHSLQAAAESSSYSAAPPVTDISHLVRKRVRNFFARAYSINEVTFLLKSGYILYL